MTTATPQFLTVEEVAKIARVKPNSVYRWKREGRGPKVTILPNGTLRYDVEAVNSWLAGAGK